MSKLLFLILATQAFFPLTSISAIAETYTLFSAPQQQANDYDAILKVLGPGDFVRFSNGASFKIKRALGAGKTTKIFAVEGGKALRIPLKAGYFSKGRKYTYFIDAFLEG